MVMSYDVDDGPEKAQAIGDCHELYGSAIGQAPEDSAMDQTNNATGRNAGMCTGSCRDKCKVLLNSGDLVGRIPGVSVTQMFGPGF